MKYGNVVSGTFLSRPNRFIAKVLIDGNEETVHVKNTGRCRELIIPGCQVYLSVSDNPKRKTKYDLIAVKKLREGKEPLLINMDSQAPNAAAEEWLPSSGLFSGGAVIRRETVYGKSRFDFYIEDGSRKAFLEVKGVTLESGGTASFPDAPTERGIKHLDELAKCIDDGYEAYILFVVQMKEIHRFTPNRETHPEFAEALKRAQTAGVKILVRDCIVTEDSLKIDDEVSFII